MDILLTMLQKMLMKSANYLAGKKVYKDAHCLFYIVTLRDTAFIRHSKNGNRIKK